MDTDEASKRNMDETGKMDMDETGKKDMDEKASSDPVTSSNQTDFEQIWLQIATDIKVRKVENLDDIPEFHQLPDQLQNQLKNEIATLNNECKIFHDEQGLKNFHVILFPKDKENYLAIYEEQTQIQQMRAIANSVGLTKVYQCLLNFISKDSDQEQTPTNDHQEQSQSVEENDLNSTESSRWPNVLREVPKINPWHYIPSFLQKSSSTSELPYNKLIEICMLRKLESISNTK
ncbi:unnamed protein product [Adineta steineri]|uniref:Uncharacterized protein n=1 Tax=Adineta steineri TaxID=433720 RepID=A0A815LT77_9BILA|nr:unnamed protein product [Adineta steineri]